MPQLTHAQYEALERAVVDGTRVAIRRRGRREHIVIPLRLALKNGREVIEARNSTTGHALEIDLEEIEHLEVVR
jgi:hypothetical protein